jgi:hypothetical protein
VKYSTSVQLQNISQKVPMLKDSPTEMYFQTGDVAQTVEYLPNKPKALNSNKKKRIFLISKICMYNM